MMKNFLIGVIGVIGVITASAVVLWFVTVDSTKCYAKFVFVIEATKSVPEDARAEAYVAIEKSGGNLQRGDELVAIPLTGDAATQASGKVARFRLSTKRKAFDADLKEAREKIQTLLNRMREETAAEPFIRTDLLGSLRIAAEENRGTEDGEFILAVLSDMIHDTPDLNFNTHTAFANEESARKFGRELAERYDKVWKGARIFLGQLRSEDLKKLKTERREAIRSFWIEFFKAGGASEVVFATDGVGQLPDFMRGTKGENE